MEKIRKLQNDIHDIYFKTDKCEVQCRKFEVEIQNLYEGVFSKAEYVDLVNLENKTNELKNTYTPQKMHFQLEDKLNGYITRQEYRNLIQEFDEAKEVIDNMCTFHKMKIEMKKFSEEFSKSHTEYVMKSDLLHQMENFVNEINEVKKIREVDRNSIISISEELQLVSLTIPKLVRSDEAKATMLLAVSDLREQMDSIIPIAEECYSKINEYSKEIDKAKVIIQRFDEIMLEKASKFSLDELNQEFKDYKNTDHLKELRAQFNNTDLFVRTEITELRSNITQYKNELQMNIISSLRKFCNEVNCQLRNGEQEVNVTKREFEQRLDLKIDKIDFNSKTKEKTDTVKFNESNKLLINTHSQLNHTIVLLIEALKIMAKKPNDTENSVSSKLNYILKQAISIYNWSEKSFGKSLLVNENIPISTYRNQVTRRSCDSSPLQCDLLEVKNDDNIKPSPFNATLSSPISINCLK